MKTLILLYVLLAAACAAFGQGEIAFANLYGGGGPVDAPVTNWAGNRILGPGPYVADFFWSANTNASMDSLSASGVNATFSAIHAGYFFGGAIRLPVADTILAQVRVWDTSYGATYERARDTGGEFGFSNLIFVVPSIPPGQPTPLVGLQGFQLQVIPEPSMSALFFLGGCLVLLTRRKRVQTT